MTKKIFALVMVIGVLGAFMVGGCKKADDAAAATTSDAAATAGTAGTAGTAATTGK